MRVIAGRVGLLVVGVVALWCLIRLHALEQEPAAAKIDVTHARIPNSPDKSELVTMIRTALTTLQAREQTKFDTREALYTSIDGALEVPMPATEPKPPDPKKRAATTPAAPSPAKAGSVAEETVKQFAAMVATSRELATEEEDFRKTLLTAGPPVAYEANDEHKSTEAQLARFVERRQRMNQLYLSRATALASYDAAMRRRVRAHLDTIPDKDLGMTATASPNEFAKNLGDRKHPLHVIYDLLWYAALVTAVVCLTMFVAGGVLAIIGTPELRGAFSDRASKLMDADFRGGGGGGGGGLRTAGAIASAAAITLVGLGTIAGTVGGASSSPWTHAELLTGGIGNQSGKAGATGAAGAKGSAGAAGTAGAEGAAGAEGTAGVEGAAGAAGANGAPGERGEVVHKVQVEVAPVKLDPSQIELMPTYVLPDPPAVTVTPTFKVPDEWGSEFQTMKTKFGRIDEEIVGKVTIEVATQVQESVKPFKTKVDELDKSHEAAINSSATVDVAGPWAWLPWHREFQVGEHELTVLERALPENRRNDVMAAVRALQGRRLRYFAFLGALRTSLTAVLAEKDQHMREVDAVMSQNAATVLSVCRVRR